MIYPKEYKELEKTVKVALKILEKEALPVINPLRKVDQLMHEHIQSEY